MWWIRRGVSLSQGWAQVRDGVLSPPCWEFMAMQAFHKKGVSV